MVCGKVAEVSDRACAMRAVDGPFKDRLRAKGSSALVVVVVPDIACGRSLLAVAIAVRTEQCCTLRSIDALSRYSCFRSGHTSLIGRADR